MPRCARVSVCAVEFGVTTEELEASARSLRTDGEQQRAAGGPLRSSASPPPSWTVGRACRAAQAFFDTVDEAARRSAAGLTGLGDQLGAAAGGYDAVESRLTPG